MKRKSPDDSKVSNASEVAEATRQVVFDTAMQQRATDATESARLHAAVASAEFMLETDPEALAHLPAGNTLNQYRESFAWTEPLHNIGFPHGPVQTDSAEQVSTVLAALNEHCVAIGLPVLACTDKWLVVHIKPCNGIAVLHSYTPPQLTPLFLDMSTLLVTAPTYSA